VWNDFCDWYVELAKPRISQAGDASGNAARGTLARVLRDMLALLHPFTPYLTEVLWGALHETLGERADLLMNSPWPDGAGLTPDERAEADMAVIQDLVGAVRGVRALTMVGERNPLRAVIAAPRPEERRVLEEHARSARALAFLESFELVERAERPPRSAVAVAGGIEAFVLLSEDVDLGKLRDVLARRVEKLVAGLGALDKKLENVGFLSRAEPEVVAAERARRAELVLERELLERNLAGL
jgi:valyl-tRNA synthetase